VSMEHGQKKHRKCKRCGQCCELIPFHDTTLPNQFEFEKGVLVRDDFMQEHFKLIEKPTTKPNRLMSDEEFGRMYYYRCELHDKKTGKCTIYEGRPVFCRNYPRGVKPEHLLSDECGYARNSEVK